MALFSTSIDVIKNSTENDKGVMLNQIVRLAQEAGYTVADIDTARPWGGFVRFSSKDGDRFTEEFFPGVNPTDARLGDPDAELSPKILLVAPNQRLSWQRHSRRAERWVFLTKGGYHKSLAAEDMGRVIPAEPGHVVQFSAGECHRLVGDADKYTIVAEIWQHTNQNSPSDEDDIVRLQDDYKR